MINTENICNYYRDNIDSLIFSTDSGIIAVTADGRIVSDRSIPAYMNGWKDIQMLCNVAGYGFVGLKKSGTVLLPPQGKNREVYNAFKSAASWSNIKYIAGSKAVKVEHKIPEWPGWEEKAIPALAGVRRDGTLVTTIPGFNASALNGTNISVIFFSDFECGNTIDPLETLYAVKKDGSLWIMSGRDAGPHYEPPYPRLFSGSREKPAPAEQTRFKNGDFHIAGSAYGHALLRRNWTFAGWYIPCDWFPFKDGHHSDKNPFLCFSMYKGESEGLQFANFVGLTLDGTIDYSEKSIPANSQKEGMQACIEKLREYDLVAIKAHKENLIGITRDGTVLVASHSWRPTGRTKYRIEYEYDYRYSSGMTDFPTSKSVPYAECEEVAEIKTLPFKLW